MKGFVLFLFLVAAFVVFFGGLNMATIGSVSGDTIMEAYYHSMGWVIMGFSVFLFSAGLGIGMVIESLEMINKISRLSLDRWNQPRKQEEKNLKENILSSNSNIEAESQKNLQNKKGDETPTIICPICMGKIPREDLRNFCPFCGADLRKFAK